MAYSQKHSGKVLVPWFNTAEWQVVYNNLTSNSKEELSKALAILKIWKVRTPLLSAGVDGTLILLEALLCDCSLLSDYATTQIYSLALLRFLNICAANNTRQGTFNRTASKNDLPKWLIDIRHDIAHGHTLPSNPLLEFALTQSFHWLIEKYWDVQSHTLCDYIVDIESSNTKIIDSLNIYIRLCLNKYKNIDMNAYDEALMSKVNYLSSKRFNSSETDSQGLLLILEEILKQAFADPDNKDVANKVAEILVDNNALIGTCIERSDEGKEMLPKSFKAIWANLLNILYENENFLHALLNQLLVITQDFRNGIAQRIASLWIVDILDGLLKIKNLDDELNKIPKEKRHDQVDFTLTKLNLKSELERKYPEYKDCVEFESFHKIGSVNLEDFEKRVLEKSNIYTLLFLERAMKFNKKSLKTTNVITELVKCMYADVNTIKLNDCSYFKTVDDLPFDIQSLSQMSSMDVVERCIKRDQDVPLVEETIQNGRRWRWTKVQDTASYKNCPLGVLPNQSRAQNPLIHGMVNGIHC